MFKPVEKKSLAASVFEQLRDHIVQGEVEPGERLPAERVLAEQLGVNRAAVREGLKRLEQAGLVAIHHGGATRVLDYRESGSLDLLASLLVRSDGSLDTAVVRAVVELRAALAPEIGRLAARRGGEVTARRCRALVAQMRASDDLVEVQGLALEYWRAVVEGTDNLAFRLAFNSADRTYGPVQPFLTNLLKDEITAFGDYDALATAIASADEPGAAEAARAITRRGHDKVAAVLAALDAAGAP